MSKWKDNVAETRSISVDSAEKSRVKVSGQKTDGEKCKKAS